MFNPEKHMRILRLVLGAISAALGLALIMAWMTDALVIGLWIGIPCLAFAGYLVFRWGRRKWLVRKLIREVGEQSRR